MKIAREIYCDESGFTGNNLSDMESPYFTYASVDVSNNEAGIFVEEIIERYKIQNKELKFVKLSRNNTGRKVISETLKKFCDKTKLVIHHKKYSLACNLFEYIFEPVLANKNSIFYNLKFNQFISNIIYVSLQANSIDSVNIFDNFQAMMRSLTYKKLSGQTAPSKPIESQNFIEWINIFCNYHKLDIEAELKSLSGTGTGKWVLDLSHTSICSLLAEWGQQYTVLDVYCDHSKPIHEQPDVFQAMVGNRKKLYTEIAGRKHPISFNLKSNINFVNSKEYPGIQIADIFAGAAALIAKERMGSSSRASYSKVPEEWVECIIQTISDYSVVPDIDNLNMESFNTQINLLLFYEIMRRTVEKEPILDNIESFISNMQLKLLYQPL